MILPKKLSELEKSLKQIDDYTNSIKKPILNFNKRDWIQSRKNYLSNRTNKNDQKLDDWVNP